MSLPGRAPADRRVRAALCGNEAWQLARVYGEGRRERLAAACELLPGTLSGRASVGAGPEFDGVEALFSTWGMDEELARRAAALPDLKAFFYAAGSVQAFARPLLDRGVVVVSAWAANALPVARFALAQVLLSLKGYFRNVRETEDPANLGRLLITDAPGIHEGETVALLGAGRVARTLIDLLRPFGLDVAVHDPFLGAEEAQALGVRRVSLAEAFATARVVSNHLPDLPATRGLLDGRLFASLPPGATFLNTGRGATVVEPDLADVLARRPDLTALLDVTHPEPPAPDSPWYRLPNVRLSSHIAGSNGREVVRMADLVLEEFAAWREGRPLQHQVTAAMLATLA